MIRILSGKYKNRKLNSFTNLETRPTQSRVKKSLFDSIQDLANPDVLDLFCGVGSLGIEAYSRGAKSIVFVDNSNKSINILKKNIILLSMTTESCVVNSDVFKFLKNNVRTFDLIIADPPYAKFVFSDFIPFVSKILNPGGVFCYETSKKEKIECLSSKVKKIGDTKLIYWRNV